MGKSEFILVIALFASLCGCLSQGPPPDTIELKNGSFQPSLLKVDTGTTVTWSNHNGTVETVTAKDGSFDSEDLANGYEFRYTFLEPGTYTYYSKNNPSLQGVVLVSSPSVPLTPGAKPTESNASTLAQPSATINLVAKNIAFNTSTITVPAGANITVNFDNEDANVPHNFAVYETEAAQNAIFQGKTITGPAQTTYSFKAPNKPGTYFFRCDVHPTQMYGQFIVVSSTPSKGLNASVSPAPPATKAAQMNISMNMSSKKTPPSKITSANKNQPASNAAIGLVAKNIAFNTSTITVPAGSNVMVNFDNQDSGVPHNFAVYETSAAQKAIFQGKIITGPAKTTYTFKAPDKPGTYFFRCDVHPTIMKGQLIVVSSTPSGGSNASSIAAQPTSPASPAGTPEVLVEIKKYAYSPDSITVPAGTTVIWRNLDSVSHTVTAASGKFDSGIINRDKNFSYTFKDPGTYDYYCTIHPYMKAQVIVTPSGAPQPAPANISPSQVGETQSLGVGTMTVPVSTTSPEQPVRMIIDLLAKDMSFDKNKITVIAGSKVYINFVNLDAGVPHNFAVYTGSEARKSIFQGQPITGPAQITYSFDAPVDTGTYFFRCDIHPKVMTGDFYVVSSDNLLSPQVGAAPQNHQEMINMSMSGSGTPTSASNESVQNASTASNQGVTVDLTAENIAFDKSTITVPAGAKVTVNFDNRDSGVPHNFAVYETDAAENIIFQGKIITGPDKITYNFVAPDKPGTYFFRCDVHPTTMKGQFVVE